MPPVVIASIRQIPSALLRRSRTVMISEVQLPCTNGRRITSHRSRPTCREIDRSACAQLHELHYHYGTNPQEQRQNNLSSWILSELRSGEI